MKRFSLKKTLAFVLSLCLVLSFCPMQVFALGFEVGDTVTKEYSAKLDDDALSAEAPESVDGAVWVNTDSDTCGVLLEHTHGDGTCVKTCDHALANVNGHFQSCYGGEWDLCTHGDDATKHTGKVTISVNTLGEIKNANAELYDRLLEDCGGAIWKLYTLYGKTYCYTVDFNNLSCTHVCSGECCGRDEHTHETGCYKYTWTLKADENRNGIADDADTYYTVKYVNEDDVIAEFSVLTGLATPVYEGAAPEKTADAKYTYTFSGWDKELAASVTEDAVYTALYEKTLNDYTITWYDEDGTVLETDENVLYGTMPSYDGETPVKEGNNELVYTFAGWAPEVDLVSGDAKYTATYTEKNVYTVSFNFLHNDIVKTEYVVDGEKVTAPLYSRDNYTVSGWYTDEELINEFDFDTEITSSVVLYAKWAANNDINDDGIADEEQNNTVIVKADNAAVTINGEAVSETEVALKSQVTVTVAPADGYAVESVVVNGEGVEAVYNSLTAEISFNTEFSAEYIVEAEVVKTALVLKSETEIDKFGTIDEKTVFDAVYDKENSTPVLSAESVTVEYLATTISFTIPVVNKEYNYQYWATPGEDVTIDAFLQKYNIPDLLKDYVKTALAENAPHNFGELDAEAVRVSFGGDEKYPSMSAEGEVNIIDGRDVTELTLNNAVITYSETLTEEDIFNAVFVAVTSGEEILDVTFSEDMTVVIDSFNAGTHTVTVSFKGDREYKNSSAQAELTIEKAQQAVTVTEARVKYGAELNASALIDTGAADRVEIVAGLKLGEHASVDAGTVVYVNLPALVDAEAIENETIRKLVESVLDKLGDGNVMTIAEFRTVLESISDAISYIEDSGLGSLLGFELNSDGIDVVINVLEQIEKLDFINELLISATMGKDIVLTDAGAYLNAAVIVDSNYNFNAGVNYALITPDGYKAKLDWIIDDENGIVTHSALSDGYDLGAYVSSVNEGSVEDAQKNVINVFAGVDINGEFIITRDQAELPVGAFAELSFILDLGNTMYYAKPVARAFVIVSGLADVLFVDEDGNENNDRQFGFDGNAHSMSAIVLDKDGNELDSENIKYYYFGVTTAGDAYYSEEAPVNSGAYTVAAVYVSADKTLVGIGTGAMVIIPAEPEIAVKDTYEIYDGEEHFVNVVNPLGLQYISLIADDKGNVNIVFPADWNVESITVVDNLREVIAKLEAIIDCVPVEYLEQYCESIKEIEAELTAILSSIDLNSAKINGTLPVEDGIYNIKLIAFGNANYQLAIAEGTLEIHKHEYIGFITVVPNCHSEGETTYECIECGDKYKEAIAVDKGAHDGKTEIRNAAEENCGKDGYTGDKYCLGCETMLEEGTVIEATGDHDYKGVITTVPTCHTKGVETFTCTVCKDEYTEDVEEDKENHDGETEIRNAAEENCGKDGYTGDKYCLGCETMLEEGTVIEATGDHDYKGVITTVPTCHTKGVETFTCTVCKDEYTEDVEEDKENHDGETEIRNAAEENCGKDGYTGDKYCLGCETMLEEGTVIEATGDHDYKGVITTVPTCHTKGVETFTCTVCKDEYTKDLAIDKNNHKAETEVKNAVAAGCETDGYSGDVYCKGCDAELEKGHTVKATGHNFVDSECSECGIVHVVKKYLLADINKDGVINAADARLALRFSVKLETLEGLDVILDVIDVNCDGKGTAADARLILRSSVKLEPAYEKIITVEYMIKK